ncbi:hypothetical protein [Usitatibacter palustris]|uniref:DUF3313 domain-containing protein n=1 Tax=Usitatibacter palustris TaxID=2732487 RepID=A0A6M4H4R3_9PROT|nr:hypothetical protein [Usitatibacter palustris]QJR14480.1 hypothetical protein DSM104440_01278 [Usitatibacter palustris]
MDRRNVMVFSSLMFLAAAAFAQDALQAVKSKQLDQLQVAPGLSAYKKVLIDPSKAEVHPGWMRSMNDGLGGPKVKRADVDRIAKESAKGLDMFVAPAFKANGYEIVTAPGPGVMRIAASANEIYVNAPDTNQPGVMSATEDAGTARMRLVATDSVSGKPLARTEHKLTASGATGSPTRATNVSNRFWFGNAFERWAVNVAKELQAATPPAPKS